MANCRKCQKKFPLFTIRQQRFPNPLGDGCLCKACYRPYGLLLDTYKKYRQKDQANARALSWVAICYLLSARRLNLVRTITAAIVGVTETTNSSEVCRQKALELASRAMSMISFDSSGQSFVKEIIKRAENMKEPPSREMTIQRYASVWGDSISDIEDEAVMQSGITIAEMNNYIATFPGHQWLVS